MAAIHVGSTGALSSSFLHTVRTLLDSAFAGDFTDEDWQHAIGGIHVWMDGPDGLISHGAIVERTLICSGETLEVGYVEAVGTRDVYRRQGYGTAVMNRIGELLHQDYALGVLSTGAPTFYETLGWERWRGPTFVNGPSGRRRTPDDDGGIMILRTPRSPRLDPDGEIVCDWRPGDVW